MIIALAQLKSICGDIDANIGKHLSFIEKAAEFKSNLIVFPELSLTGYEPTLAKELALNYKTEKLLSLQEAADNYQIVIGAGMPTMSSTGLFISIIIFLPNENRKVHSKSVLHEDEMPCFDAGTQNPMLELYEEKVAFGICYESMQPYHLEEAKSLGATIYIASVAKHEKGIAAARRYFSSESQKW